MKEDRQFVTALSRGLDVLRCFSPTRQVLSATEIAGRLGLPQPTVWRMCHTLVNTGYLVPVPGGKLRIGSPALTLGYAALASLDYLQVIRPHMQELAERFGASVVLAERHRKRMIYLEACQGESLLIMNLPVGSKLSLHDTATGWAYLAALTEAERAQALEPLRRDLADEWPAHQANIDREVERYAQHGFVLNVNTPHDKFITVAAVPVAGLDGKPGLVLNCSVVKAMFSEEQVIQEVVPALMVVAHLLEAQIATSRKKGKKKLEGVLQSPRIEPVSDADATPEQQALLAERQREGAVYNVYRTLIHAPKAAEAFRDWGRYILSELNDLPARQREIVILRAGFLCGSGIIWNHDAHRGSEAGLSDEEIERVKHGAEAPGWDSADAALIQATDELNKYFFISDETWAELGKHFTRKQQMDVVFTVGQYTQVSMILNSFGVQPEVGQILDHDLKIHLNPRRAG